MSRPEGIFKLEIVISILAFVSVFLFLLGLRNVIQPGAVQQRLQGLASPSTALGNPGTSMVRRRETGILGVLSRVGGHREIESDNPIVERLVHGGYRRASAPAIFYGIRICLAIGLPLFASMLPVVWALSTAWQIGVVGLLTSIGFVLPSAYLDRRVSVRKSALTRALPDALDLLVVCVEAGLGINQGLARVAQEFLSKSPLLSAELALVGHHTRAGKTTTEALRDFANRTGVGDVSSLVALLVQTERFGTNVANALRVHADAMRIRRMQAAEERAQIATLKLILPSTMIFSALLLVFLAPGMHNFISAFSSMPD